MAPRKPKRKPFQIKRLLTKSSSSKKVGMPPGSLVSSGEITPTKITLITYDNAHFEEKTVSSIEDCFAVKKSTSGVSWINIDGLSDLEMLKKLGEHFEIHPLVLEDILNTDQRPKLDDYDNYLFVIVKMLYVETPEKGITTEQVGLILGKHFVISFQEKEGDVFQAIRRRLREGKGTIRTRGADYLAYALLDSIVDNYFIILEHLDTAISKLEEELMTKTAPDFGRRIHYLKRELIFLKKQVWPLRELISNLQRFPTGLVSRSIQPFLRDVYDHTVQVADALESFRDMTSGIHDIHLSEISNRMNEVMKVLTIFAAVFIPITFIAGVYGMNFQYMPELQWKWSYFVVLGVMAVMALGMLAYFKKKDWL